MEIREQAALICAICASTRYERGHAVPFQDLDYMLIQEAMGFSKDARYLAEDAWREVILNVDVWTREVDAEAEALLRCGWTPEST